MAEGTAVPADDTVLAGRYRLARRLGVGGMGEVWEAHDEVLQRQVAVKVVIGAHRHDEAILARFEREARSAARLTHPNVATVYDYGDAEQGAYLVMELVEGETLAERLGRGPLAHHVAAQVVADAAEGLAAAHADGILHRDVKPSNLMLGDDGTKLMDFGIAATVGDDPLTRSGTIIGTAAYLAPERLRGEPAGTAADVYALGAVLFEAVTARRAFTGATPAEVGMAHLHQPSPDLGEIDPNTPAAVVAACREALAKDPATRPSARGLATRLRGVATGAAAITAPLVAPVDTTVPVVAPGPITPPAGVDEAAMPAPDPSTASEVDATASSTAEARAEPERRRRALVLAGVVTALLLVVGLVAAMATAGDDDPATTGAADPSTTTTAAPSTTTTETPTTATPAPPPPTAEDGADDALAEAARGYLDALASGDLDGAWQRTSPAFRQAQDRSSWRDFWTGFDSIEVVGPIRTDERDASATVPLSFDGQVEDYRLTFVPGPDDGWLVDGPVGSSGDGEDDEEDEDGGPGDGNGNGNSSDEGGDD